MLVTGGGAIKPEADICPPQLDTEARGEAETLVVQRRQAPEIQSSSKALSDPNRKQWPSKNPTIHFRSWRGGWKCVVGLQGGIRGPYHNLRSFVLLGGNTRRSWLKLVTSGQRTGDSPISSGVYRLNTHQMKR